MKKQIIFLAVCAIVLSMGSCTNDVLEDIQQVNGSLPQTRTTTNNEWTYAYVLSEGQLGTTIQGTIVRYNNSWVEEDVLEIGDTGNDLIQIWVETLLRSKRKQPHSR